MKCPLCNNKKVSRENQMCDVCEAKHERISKTSKAPGKPKSENKERERPLTRRLSEYVDFIIAHMKEHGFPPTNRIIQEHFGFTQPTASYFGLKALEKRGYIEKLIRGKTGYKVLKNSAGKRVRLEYLEIEEEQ